MLFVPTGTSLRRKPHAPDSTVVGPGVLASLVGLLVCIAYSIYLEGDYGRTLGKMALDLVVTEDGEPVDDRAATVRTVLRAVDVSPVPYLVGFVLVVVTDRKQRLGDLAADTVVRTR